MTNLRKHQNRTGYRSLRERENSFGMCFNPKGFTFRNSKERTTWLAKRYGELEADALSNWGKLSVEGGDREGTGQF